MEKIITNAKEDELCELPGEFWVITTYFNPTGAVSKSANLRYFSKVLKKQEIKLLIVECALKGASFELQSSDADKLVQVKSDSILWHKERLLNIALKNLPGKCDKIAWLDSDIVFLDSSWADKASKLLKKYHFVKPFDQAFRLDKQETEQLISGADTSDLNFQHRPKYKNSEYDISNEDLMVFMSVFGLCARKEIMQKIGFYDKFIIGNGDMIMSGAMLKKDPYPSIMLSRGLKNDIDSWTELTQKEIKDKGIAVLEGAIVHLFHGRIINRNYYNRVRILKKHKYNPDRDLKINSDGCFELQSDKKGLHQALSSYFRIRNEDDKILTNVINFSFYKVFAFKRNVIDLTHRTLGLSGKIINRFFPQLYHAIKKQESRRHVLD